MTNIWYADFPRTEKDRLIKMLNYMFNKNVITKWQYKRIYKKIKREWKDD